MKIEFLIVTCCFIIYSTVNSAPVENSLAGGDSKCRYSANIFIVICGSESYLLVELKIIYITKLQLAYEVVYIRVK